MKRYLSFAVGFGVGSVCIALFGLRTGAILIGAFLLLALGFYLIFVRDAQNGDDWL